MTFGTYSLAVPMTHDTPEVQLPIRIAGECETKHFVLGEFSKLHVEYKRPKSNVSVTYYSTKN